jgi:hypothetical protein
MLRLQRKQLNSNDPTNDPPMANFDHSDLDVDL